MEAKPLAQAKRTPAFAGGIYASHVHLWLVYVPVHQRSRQERGAPALHKLKHMKCAK